MTKETLKVEGMSCGHCVSAIEDNVGELKGVSNVKVHLDKAQVDVEFDPSVVTLNQIKETIEEEGYDIAL